jgi:hypothetical protein
MAEVVAVVIQITTIRHLNFAKKSATQKISVTVYFIFTGTTSFMMLILEKKQSLLAAYTERARGDANLAFEHIAELGVIDETGSGGDF